MKKIKKREKMKKELAGKKGKPSKEELPAAKVAPKSKPKNKSKYSSFVCNSLESCDEPKANMKKNLSYFQQKNKLRFIFGIVGLLKISNLL